ncbi:alcohol oxidase [Xylariaceae sp. FL0016]|nr:alcohol oxidase [Xylariaceae sp. FL0016]
MGLYSELPANIETVDVIIAGGGTAGCIVAAGLAEADPSFSILVIESGPNGVGNPAVDYPAFFLNNLLPTTTGTSFYKSGPSASLAGRDLVVPCGNVLGGGSAINMMMYSRAQRSDWDSWQTPGWSANEILPVMRKLETYHDPGSMDRHGSSGPIQDDFVPAMNQAGWPEIEDLGSLDDCNEGKRQDTASRYLHPRLEDGLHSNLHVVVESQVVRVLFDGQRASGVLYRPKIKGAAERLIKARKLVVISCGAFGTPTVLERSGVGNPTVLKGAGIPQIIANVPGVGHEHDDHHLIVYPYKSSLEPEETLDGILTGKLDPGELIQKNHKTLGWNAQEVTCKIRPTDSDVAALRPDFQDVWYIEFKDNPNRLLMMMALVNCFPGEPIGVPPGQYFGVSTFTAYPFSRGHVHITGPEASDAVDFDAGFFADGKGIDLRKHRWAYKRQREVARRMQVFRGELPSGHPAFPADSKAACVAPDGPLENVQDIEYSAEDDKLVDDFAREHVSSAWHSSGTCTMAPFDQNGVVDSSLRVYGVEGLKLADLSIVPKSVAANTNHTALVIGEKAASIIIEELGLGACITSA